MEVEARDEGESCELRRKHAKSNEEKGCVSTKLIFVGRDIELIYKEPS